MKNGTCIKCGSHNVRKMETLDRSKASRQLHLVEYRDPTAIFFNEPVLYPMHAMACFHCGYTELYLNQPITGEARSAL